MLTQITCPHCRHVGVTTAPLPRVLAYSQCGHGALIKQGRQPRSPSLTRDERAAERAAWKRYEMPTAK